MGYACPVCDDPQQDAEHLANHLAFQALTHGNDHESWLDEHTPGWAEGGPADLAPRLAELAEEAEYEVVFADTTEERGDGERYDPDLQGVEGLPGQDHRDGGVGGHDHGHDHRQSGGDGIDVSNLDPEARDVVEEARSLTREMLEEGADDAADADDGEGADDAADE